MKIVEKIKALLAKASGTDNEAEAEIFFAKAYELMEKHQLDVSDLDRDDPMGDELSYKRADRGGVDWDSHLMFGVALYYGAKAILWKQEKSFYMKIVGRESARVTAIEMHKYLVVTVRRLGREHASATLNADQTARRIGTELNRRLHDLARSNKESSNTTAARNALVTVDQIQVWIEKHYPNLVSFGGKKVTSANAREIAGGISLHKQTGSRTSLRIGG